MVLALIDVSTLEGRTGHYTADDGPLFDTGSRSHQTRLSADDHHRGTDPPARNSTRWNSATMRYGMDCAYLLLDSMGRRGQFRDQSAR